VLARSAIVRLTLERALFLRPAIYLCNAYLADMAPKYQLTPEQLALQEERKRKRAEKQAAAAVKGALKVPTTGKDAIIIRDWLRRRDPRTSESSIKIMNWNVRANISVHGRETTNVIGVIRLRCSRKRSSVRIFRVKY
jgi:hypothetical protein